MARIEPIVVLPAVEVVRRLGGRATRDEVLRRTSAHHLRQALTAGELVAAARGVYVLASLPEPRTAAARCRGVLSHASAAQALGLGLAFPPRAVHVTVPRGARPPEERGVVVHRSDLRPDEVDGERTSLVRTVLDCAATMPLREALPVADSLLITHPHLAGALRQAAHSRHGAGRRAGLTVATQANPLAANAFESMLRGIAIEAGLTGFVPQYPITTRRLGTVRVDLGDPGSRVALEADSFEWHGRREALAADCFRYAEVERTGWLVVRFAWEHVMFEWDWVAEVLLDVVSAR